MDESQFELAERISEEEKNTSIKAAQVAAAPEHHPDFDGLHCIDCGIEIPSARLNLGKIHCVECQELIETKRKNRIQ